MKGSAAGVIIAVLALLMVPVLVVLLVLVVAADSSSAGGPCLVPGVKADASGVDGSVAGFSGEQLANAAAIMSAASDLGLPVAAQMLGVQAAIGESSLRVLDRGDAVGPDSRGLFQQRANGAWGSYEDRMDPRTSATNFFKALQRVDGWKSLRPTIAIHRVQRNAVADHYVQYRDEATKIVKALSGGELSEIDSSGVCPSDGGKVIGELAGEWVNPLPGGSITSRYGPRAAPAGSANLGLGFHYGLDLATPGGGGVVRAPTDMKITIARESDGMFGTRVNGTTLDGELTIGLYHLAAGSLKVSEGDTVAAGTPLGIEGATGNVSGPHLHIEFFKGTPNEPSVPGDPTVDPLPILRDEGAL